MVTPTYDQTLEKLNHAEWKNNITIAREIANDLSIDASKINRMRMNPILRKIESDGLAIHRENYEDSARVHARGGRPVFEYKLTEEGVRTRYEKSKARSGLDALVDPANA